MSRIIIYNVILLNLLGFLFACSKNKAEFLTLPEEAQEIVYQDVTYVIIAGGDTNHRGIAMYDEQGNLVQLLKHYRDPAELGTPRGLIQFGNDNILISLDNTDRIENLNLSTLTSSFFFSGGTLSGNIYDLAADSNNNILVMESNGIERFDETSSQTTPLYIGSTLGACVLSNPRQMIVNSNDELLVTSYSNDRILHYDVSTSTAACLTTTGTTTNPYGILAHSNGSIYYNTWSDDQIYRASADGSGGVVVFATNLTILNNPTAMAELPDGTILVASSNTDTVEQFDEDGNYISTFIRDTESLNITDIIVITRQEIVE